MALDDFELAYAVMRLVEDLPTLGQLTRAHIQVVLDDVSEERVDAAIDAGVRYGALDEIAGYLWPSEQEKDQG